ncbi:MAG: hypothetical protein DMG68_13425 [Acidobacteria bacterium]|jgi:hypothetical protein|nr:MAG: hypothetical protein DMG68_13425 [Acidobacteriota bacterium]
MRVDEAGASSRHQSLNARLGIDSDCGGKVNLYQQPLPGRRLELIATRDGHVPGNAQDIV